MSVSITAWWPSESGDEGHIVDEARRDRSTKLEHQVAICGRKPWTTHRGGRTYNMADTRSRRLARREVCRECLAEWTRRMTGR